MVIGVFNFVVNGSKTKLWIHVLKWDSLVKLDIIKQHILLIYLQGLSIEFDSLFSEAFFPFDVS